MSLQVKLLGTYLSFSLSCLFINHTLHVTTKLSHLMFIHHFLPVSTDMRHQELPDDDCPIPLQLYGSIHMQHSPTNTTTAAVSVRLLQIMK